MSARLAAQVSLVSFGIAYGIAAVQGVPVLVASGRAVVAAAVGGASGIILGACIQRSVESADARRGAGEHNREDRR